MHDHHLIVVRHAKSGGGDALRCDFDRMLDDRGVADGRRMAPILAERLPAPERVLCSPARRARDTLAFLVPELVDPRRVDYPQALYLADLDALLAWVRATPRGCRVLLLLGHNPGLTALVNHLSAYGTPPLDNLPTLGTAHLRAGRPWSDWHQGCAERVALIHPKAFRTGTDGNG